jgi:hypothetical protein
MHGPSSAAVRQRDLLVTQTMLATARTLYAFEEG